MSEQPTYPAPRLPASVVYMVPAKPPKRYVMPWWGVVFVTSPFVWVTVIFIESLWRVATW